MEADERKIVQVLQEQIRYEIPPYQRPYSWEKENVEQLLSDIWEAFEGKDGEYFIGSILTIEKIKDTLYEVVDGQQRLTAINLVLARLRDAVSEPAKSELGKRLLPKNILTGEKGMPRLLLRQKDQTFFRNHVLEGQKVTEKIQQDIELKQDAPKLRILENLQAIDAFLKDKEEKTLCLFADYLLNKVYVVFVIATSQQSAVRLFNVLNARGVPLSSADLIKNMLFAKLDSLDKKITNSEEELDRRWIELDRRWIELEEIIGIKRLDQFLEHHRLSVKSEKAKKVLHEEYKPLIEESDSPSKFMDKIMASAKSYNRIQYNEFQDVGTCRLIRSLHRVIFKEWMAALLAFLNNPVDGMSEEEFIELLEKVTYQNWIRRLGSSARLTVYSQLIKAIFGRESAADIRAIFQQNAQNKELRELLDGVVYGKPFATALLQGLEDAYQDMSVTKIYARKITIEHVLPQALKDKYWEDRFSDDEHKLWLHRLGNLTLLDGIKNHKAQYYSFDRKKNIYNERQNKVSFDMTKEILGQGDWTVEVIEERHKEMLKSAISIWEIS